jgi:uracil-DNA glycosylase
MLSYKEELKDWYPQLSERVDLVKLAKQLTIVYSAYQVYPAPENIFRIFKELAPRDVRVIITGLDPYHDGKASGIAFGVTGDILSPTLKVIETEVETSVYPLEFKPFDYSLMNWVRQGVFLYNTALTVREGMPSSHITMWEDFTKGVFSILNEIPGLIWVLWGNEAKKLKKYINPQLHHIIEGVHPSAECYKRMAGFYECDHFNLINEIIIGQNGEEYKIKW